MIEQREHFMFPKQLAEREPHGDVMLQGEFLNDFDLEMRRDGVTEVGTMAMVMHPDEVGNKIKEMFASLPEHVKKTVIFDAYSFLTAQGMITYPYQLLPWTKKSAQNAISAQQRFVEEMESHNIDVNIINEPKPGMKGFIDKLIPVRGRTHMKGSFVKREDGNSVFYVQTSNNEDEQRLDLHIKLTGAPADKLIDVFQEINQNPPKEDKIIKISDDIELYIDAGIPGKSIILQKAKELSAATKKNILNISLFTPDGIAQELDDAQQKRHVDTQVIRSKFHLSRPLISINNVFYIVDKLSRVSRVIQRHKFRTVEDPYHWAHGKLTIFDDEVAFIGSHNMSSGGVRAGTREWQLLIRDKQIVNGLKRKFYDFMSVASAEEKLAA